MARACLNLETDKRPPLTFYAFGGMDSPRKCGVSSISSREVAGNQVQSTTRITEFLVVDKSSVILVKWPKFR